MPVAFFHATGMFGEAWNVSSALALKPVIDANICPFALLAGAKVVPELTELAPNSSVTCGVTVNVAVATLPRLSTTVTVCAPATPACELAVPAGVVKASTAVPCSVTVAPEKAAALAEALLPTVTEAIVAVGPKPDKVAVTTVPTGPEFGVSVTVGVVSDSVVVPTLFQLSVMLNTAPSVVFMAGRLTVALTVPRYAPVKKFVAILLLLKVNGSFVEEYKPEATVTGLPEKFAETIWFAYVVSTVAFVVGYPEADTVTEVPATTAEGVIVTVGFVIVNVPAIIEVDASEIITVCEPGERP